jgi:hypothetical protein
LRGSTCHCGYGSANPPEAHNGNLAVVPEIKAQEFPRTSGRVVFATLDGARNQRLKHQVKNSQEKRKSESRA